ncbi:hypothetical protein QFZ62_000707 [Clavibacter sp. B3I6]|uniref:hypothetical protein n=1 Tax=Clavibacter sp. B3I6 TaxID=3042268 RepID=UPI002789998A|nr:hypothetical protein [Clavibacter sp. B3I6]MDQ0743399.1 hypothetical protein [Clavibacter sp. B3I6]
MLSDLIFGPATTTAPGDYRHYGTAIRGRVIDMEAVHEAIAAVGQRGAANDGNVGPELHPRVTVQVTTRRDDHNIAREDLDGLDRVDRQNLTIHVSLPEGSPHPYQDGVGVSIYMVQGRRTIVMVSPQRAGAQTDTSAVRARVIAALTKDGTNIVPWKQLSRHFVFLPLAVMLGCWLMVLGSGDLSAPGIVMGWTLLATVAAGSVGVDRYLAEKYALLWPGVVPRQESRAQTAARRADHKRDAWVAALGVVGGLVLAVLARALGIGS